MAKIIIELDTANGDTIERALDALRLGASSPPPMPKKVFVEDVGEMMHSLLNDAPASAEPKHVETAAADQELIDKPVRVKPSGSTDALTHYDGKRKRGSAGPNGGRRTNAQMASDTLFFEQERDRQADAARDRDTTVKTATFKTAEEAVAAMETGVEVEATVNADAAQDAADEAAETAERPADKEATLEDLRAVAARYAYKFGVKAQISDMRRILGCAIVDVPKNDIGAAIARVEEAMEAENIDAHLAKNEEPALTATKDDLVRAMLAYGQKYDGSTRPEDMLHTKEDLPKVFSETFGAGVTGLGSMPAKTPEAFGRIVAAITQTTETNRFKRKEHV